MIASYADTLPTDKDVVRAMLGDTDVAAPLLSDPHILAVLGVEGSVAAAAAFLAEELAARFAAQPVRVTGEGTTIDYTGRIEGWQRLALRLRAAVPTADGGGLTGVSVTYRTAAAADEYSRGTC